MKSIELNIEKALGTVSKSDVFALENKAKWKCCTKVRVKEMTF